MPAPRLSSPPNLPELVEATRRLHAATLVAAIVSSAERPHSLAEVLRLDSDVFNAVYPEDPGEAPAPSPSVATAQGQATPDADADRVERAEWRDEPHFGRRGEAPPPDPRADQTEAMAAGAPPTEPTPPSVASGHEAVQRVRATALNAARLMEEQSARACAPEHDPAAAAKDRRRRGPIVAVLTAMVCVSASGLWTLSHPAITGAGPARTHAGFQSTRPARRATPPTMIHVAMALAPVTGPPTGGVAVGGTAPVASRDAADFASAVEMIAANKGHGVARLKRLAVDGYGPAQFYLARLFAEGSAGVAKDPGRARRWTRRAAEAGEIKAMHNLALYYVDGTGEPANPVAAAPWFRRAADQGLVDSQFNLGRLYAQGLGVPRNDAEAFKWFLIAARSGDAQAAAAASGARSRLSSAARAAATRAAGAFQTPGISPASLQLASRTEDLDAARGALAQLGYYQGPAEGAATPALRMALAAYQRDHGLPASATADAATLAMLTSLSRRAINNP